MAYRSKTLGRLGAAIQPPSVQAAEIPASVTGINALNSLMQMAPTDCIYCHNLMPSEYGLRLRRGFRAWATIPTGKYIGTLIGFEGQSANASGDKLWAVTEDGIYDVTLFNTTDPNHDVTFNIQTTGEAGYGVYTEFTNDANERFLQYSDAENGLHEYSEETGLWSIPNITGPVVANIAFVTLWKNRLWYIENNSGAAWYLGPDSKSGQATKFTFGSKFTHGGELKSLYNWTIDGGDGMDDYLVAISRGGDVLVYRGLDPELADFGLVGSFFIGEVPESRRLGVNYGGELYLLSTFGITSVRDLLQGVVTATGTSNPSAKISRFLRQDTQLGKNDFNWQLTSHPPDGFLQVITPWNVDRPQDAIQYTQNLLTSAWGMWQGMPANCAQTWNEDYYLGGREGTVAIYDGELDGTTITGINIWSAIPNGVNPPEWTVPIAGTFAVDGTQLADTSFNVDLNSPTVIGQEYTVTYDLGSFVAGNHWMEVGGVLTPVETGVGVFTTQVVATAASSIATLWGDLDLEAQFSGVSIGTTAVLGRPIEFDILTSFQSLGSHANFKRVGFIRTIGVIAGTVSFNVEAVYDYAVETTLLPPVQPPSQGGNVWDTARWDEDLWDFTAEGASFPTGTLGMGRSVAIGMRGSSNTRINIVGWDVMFTVGGYL